MAYTITSQRVRGFQPPWRWVTVYTCDCGRVTKLRKNWTGATPPGAVLCGCGQQLRIA